MSHYCYKHICLFMPPKQMQGQLITTSRTHWVLCVDYSEVPHVGEVFHSPPPKACCRHWSAPTSSLLKWDPPRRAQQFNSQRAQRERRTRSEAEDVKISTVLQRRHSAPAARFFTSRRGQVISSKCTLQRRHTLDFLFSFF